MSNKYIDIDLNREQKLLVQEKTSFFIFSDCTKEDLNNKRKKWIRFERLAISDIIGELSYYYSSFGVESCVAIESKLMIL